MSYTKWTPPAAAKNPVAKPKNLDQLRVTYVKRPNGDRRKVTLSRYLLDKFNADSFGALDIYLDRDKGLIGIEIIKNGLVSIKPKSSGPLARKMDYGCKALARAIESFGVTFDCSFSVNLHDVSDRVPPVQLEIRIDEVRAAIKAAKAGGK